jgi:DNA-binding XRE family transcriptional regulator
MNGPALVEARTRLARTPDQMAAELGIPPHAYAACEAGRATLPRRHAEQLAFRLGAIDREEALAASGLPACTWMERWGAELPASRAALDAHVARAESHASTCTTCRARDAFIAERFPPLEAPSLPGWARALNAFGGWVEARPDWLRPAIWGASALVALTMLRVLFALPLAVREPRVLLVALGALLASAAIGTFGGLVYALLGRPLRPLPVVGPYLAGIVGVGGYLLAGLALVSLTDDAPRDPASLTTILLVVSLLLGAFVGHRWLRAPAGAAS